MAGKREPFRLWADVPACDKFFTDKPVMSGKCAAGSFHYYSAGWAQCRCDARVDGLCHQHFKQRARDSALVTVPSR